MSELKAIASYAHESRDHERRVRAFVDRLRADGIACSLDQYVDAPEQGWPEWMSAQIADSGRYVLVICSETYHHRWRLTERAGVGLGAKWEGKLIKQVLYEAEGFNSRVIPVILEAASTAHIPIELRDARRYNISSEEDYVKLVARLSGQKLLSEPPVGPPVQLISEQTEAIAAVFSVLQEAKGPLPLEALADAVGVAVVALTAACQPLIGQGFLHRSDDEISTDYRHAVLPVPGSLGDVFSNALRSALKHVKHRGLGRRPRERVESILRLAASPGVRHDAVASMFGVLDKHLKRHGDKRLVWLAADMSLKAARQEGRGEDETKAEAVALVCGRSWVLQRLGRLAEADATARESLKLGEHIHWRRNTAFCQKCLGRLCRMRAEVERDGALRIEHVEESESLLRQAIRAFEEIDDADATAEIGECHSLLARTYLVWDRLNDMDGAIKEADQRLLDENTKAYLDFAILRGDALAKRGHRDAAKSFYSEVIRKDAKGDAQISEIRARAFFARAGVQANNADKIKDDEAAAEVWRRLEDPAQYEARWRAMSLAGGVPKQAPTRSRLEREEPSVRVKVIELHRERVSTPAKRVRARQVDREPELPYWEQLIDEARRQVAIEKSEWAS